MNKEFLKIFKNARSEKQLLELFDLFFTLSEKDALDKRYLLVKELLADQKTQREIAQDLSLSISKITAGSNALKNISQELKDYLSK